MSGGSTDYLMQIVNLGMGFDVPSIQKALEETKFAGIEQAVDYLMTGGKKSSSEKNKSQPQQNQAQAQAESAAISKKAIPASTIHKLKTRVADMANNGGFTIQFTNADLEDALQQHSDVSKALNYFIDKYSDRIQPIDYSNDNNNNSNSNNNKSAKQKIEPKKTQQELRREQAANAAALRNNATKKPNLTRKESGRVFDNFENVAVSNSEDANAYKNMLKQQAQERKLQQQNKEVERQKALKIATEEARISSAKKAALREKHNAKLVFNRQKVEERKVSNKLDRRKNLLEWHKRHELYDEQDQKRNLEIDANRLKAESQIATPVQAIELMFDRYGSDTTLNVLKLEIKILSKIVTDPKNEKYRKINLSSRKSQSLLVSPLGAIAFLKFLGFEQLDNTSDAELDLSQTNKYLYLALENFKLNDCQQAIEMLRKHIIVCETCLSKYVELARADVKHLISNEELYCALQSIREILRNICISPMSEHLRYIKVDADLFKMRIGRFPKFIRLFKEIGFALRGDPKLGQARVLVFNVDLESNNKIAISSNEHPQMRLLLNVLRDIETESKKMIGRTPIGEGVSKLISANQQSNDPTQVRNLFKLFAALVHALQRILDEPLEMKYQSISVEKLHHKYMNVVGIVSLLKLLGFKKSHKKEPQRQTIVDRNTNKRVKSKKQLLVGIDGVVVANKKTMSKIYDYDISDLDLLKWRKKMLQITTNTK